MIDRYYRQFTPVCDCCGARLPGGESFAEAVQIKRRVKYIRIIKESAERQRVREEENLRLFQEQILIAKKDSLVYNRVD